MAGILWWTDERREELRQLTAAGLSYAEAAEALTVKHGRHITERAASTVGAGLCLRLKRGPKQR